MTEIEGRPDRFRIAHDDYHARHVGRTPEGRQFFLSNLFEAAFGDAPGREYVALFLFDGAGALVDHRIDDLGTRESLGAGAAAPPGNNAPSEVIEAALAARLAELGTISYGAIEIQPFEVEHEGVRFGFIATPPVMADEEWVVELHPGNFMAFYAPWDSGDYDT